MIIFTGLGALITYWFNVFFQLGPVLAAGIIGLAGSFIPYLNRKSDLLRELPVALYCGAFAGMTSPLVAGSYSFIILAGLMSGIILAISKTSFHGFGGKLGTIAFGGVCCVSLIIYILN
nr:hypothetical protein [Gramella oceanisediminis]